MKLIFLLVLLLSSFFIVGQKNGTITIKKKSKVISGLYKQTETSRHNPSKYLLFKENGYVYQFESQLKSDKVIELTKTNLASLRPVIANYRFQDSTLQMIPLNAGIGQSIEPSNAYYFGKFAKENLILNHQSSDVLYNYRPIR